MQKGVTKELVLKVTFTKAVKSTVNLLEFFEEYHRLCYIFLHIAMLHHTKWISRVRNLARLNP